MSRLYFWTILLGTEATSFRATDKETLVPTLKQLQRQHPEAVIKWFERGKIFDSPAEAAAAREQEPQERRPKNWRPGGDHRDPRERFTISRDEKRRRFKSQQRFKNEQAAGGGPARSGTSPPPDGSRAPRSRPVGSKPALSPRRAPGAAPREASRPGRDRFDRGGSSSSRGPSDNRGGRPRKKGGD